MNSHQLKTNFVINVVGKLAPALVGLITVPIYIAYIGPSRYGVLAVIWTLLGYFGVFDFGLSRASANALAKIPPESKDKWAEVFMTALSVNLALGFLGGAIFYGGALAFGSYLLPHTGPVGAELAGAIPWIAGMVPLTLGSGVLIGAIESRERFLAANVLDSIGFTLGQVIPIFFAFAIGPSLAVIIPALFIARLLSIIFTATWIIYSETLHRFSTFNRSRIAELLGFGVWVSVTDIVGPVMTSIDQLLIASVLGAAAVAYYSVPMSIGSRGQLIAQAVSRTLFPRFSRLAANEAAALAGTAITALGYSSGALIAPAIVISDPVLRLWIGEDFATHASPVLEILLVGTWLNGIAFIPFTLLQAQGRPDIVAKLHAVEVLPFVFILWVFMQKFGLLGAAMAWSIRVTIDAALLLYCARVSAVALIGLVPPLILILTAYVTVQLTHFSIAAAVLVATIFLAITIAVAMIFDSVSRRLIRDVREKLVSALRERLKVRQRR